MSNLESTISEAVKAGKLWQSSADNIAFLLREAEDWERASIGELAAAGEWTELNDRFYQTLKFGTGGLRGRTIGKVVTNSEWGANTERRGAPEHPAAGTNAMNFFNIGRASQGLLAYVRETFPNERTSIVISHDTRYFSRQFAEFIAQTASAMGVDAYLFPDDRSTPELSFAVRYLNAHAGVMVTASHNPPHDNGYKVYFRDGGQVVEPHATNIIKKVQTISGGKVAQPVADSERGRVTVVYEKLDKAYLDAVSALVLNPQIVSEQKSRLKIVFTPIHGTGIRITPGLLNKFGFNFNIVPEQARGNGGFPTVKSPNPENAEALTLGIEQARRENADLVLATDPDADRMGAAVRDREGNYQVITGNMIGSLLAAHRLETFFAQGILNADNAARAVLIKTFVTTDLQRAIAESYGVKCVDTLTGFKYICEKMKVYEEQAGGRGALSAAEWRARLLERSSFYVFGGEESHGYSGGDYVRDKDANAAVLMFAEMAAYAASQGLNVLEYLDRLYVRHGFYSEKLGTLTFEGAEGAAKIKKLLDSYKTNAPSAWGGRKVERVQNFAEETIFDADGKEIPKELMLLFYLEGGCRIAVRGSGTEPKIKYYFFGKSAVRDAASLSAVKDEVGRELEKLWTDTQRDVEQRVA
ncbi:MAG: phospho-sugar mutase [Verrucomicrobiales bacterium]|jgi:phosphoglucomutase|nr:phospho-sugar mutase [Verrucomicrobiales bacterium]